MRTKLTAGWQFQKQEINSYDDISNSYSPTLWKEVTVPHDYMILDYSEFKQSTEAWYRNELTIDDLSKTHYLYFEGIYMESEIFVNGQSIGGNRNGYISFYCDVTSALQCGDNEVLVHVINMQPNSRWYTGAGIYRDVWHVVKEPEHFANDSFFIKQNFRDQGVTLTFGSEVLSTHKDFTCEFAILDHEGNPLDRQTCVNQSQATFHLNDYRPWHIDAPYRYTFEAKLMIEGQTRDTHTQNFGIRKLHFHPDQGFFLNDQAVELRGACLHHDLGGFGAKYNRTAAKRNLEIMRSMGVNAIRMSHNPFTTDFLELCDEMGFCVVNEIFDMWKISKTKYDYARFFEEDAAKDMLAWLRRDRMHPSIIMWSVGNEVYDTHVDETGRKTLQEIVETVKQGDPGEHAPITFGSNYMPWENTRKCADDIKLIGYNYSEKLYDEDHKEHPDWIIYGSETGSIVQSRGIYHFPYKEVVLADDDMQCSALGNTATSWGAKSLEFLLKSKLRHPFSLGQFLWTGIDYLGEPTPYHTKNSYFGHVDTAGFTKDSYHLFQAAWTDPKDRTILHLFPHWDWNEGQVIDVLTCSNAASVELFLNDRSLGIQELNHEQAEILAHWKVPYERGAIEVKAYDAQGNVLAKKQESGFDDATKLIVREIYRSGGLYFFEITARDPHHKPVKNANNEVHVSVSGSGQLLFLNNGDSTDFNSYYKDTMQLFSGKLLAVVEATAQGTFHLKAHAPHLSYAEIEIDVQDKPVDSPSIPAASTSEYGRAFVPIRKIELTSSCDQEVTEKNSFEVRAVTYPSYADEQELHWRVTDARGVDSLIANGEIDPSDPKHLTVKVQGDGSFVVRCGVKNKKDHLDFFSSLDFVASGYGEASLDPYTFLSASLYSQSHGDIGNGNERGVSMARDEMSWIAFENLDFGIEGSSLLEIPLFSLDDDNEYWLWNGIPYEDGSALICYQAIHRPSKWNTYQMETFELTKPLIGIQTFAIEMRKKAHIKGFEFKRRNLAFEMIEVAKIREVYGDSFERTDKGLMNIGNNVSIHLPALDFSSKGASEVIIRGRANGRHNSLHLVFEQDEERIVELLEIPVSAEIVEHRFTFPGKYGRHKLMLLFLPGSDFDLENLRFGSMQRR